MIVPSRIELDVNKEASSQVIEVHKGDTKSRYISFKLFSGMIPISLEAATTAIISGVKPDNTKVYNDCISSTDSIAVVLTNQMIAVPGDVNCELVVYGDNESKLTSSKFIIRVHDVLTDGTEIESSDEFTQLDLMMQQAGDLSQAAIKALEAANSASLASVKATEAVNARDEAVSARNTASDRAAVATAQAEFALLKANTASTKADEASVSASTATTKASEASASAITAIEKAQEAVDTLAEIANARQSAVKSKTFANLDERFEETEQDIINSNNLMKVSLTEVDRELTQLQQTIQNANTNQEAKLTQVGYGAISLPKTAAQSHMTAILKGMTLKNELNYNRDTWVEVIATGPVTKDSSGVELTTVNGSWTSIKFSVNMKPTTKYGYLLNIVSNDTSVNSVYIDSFNRPQTETLRLNGTGNVKFIDTTKASFINQDIVLTTANSLPSGQKIKIRDIRIYELPTGSEIESDFNTLTADQLAIKYPYTKGDSAKNTQGVYRNRSVGKNLIPESIFESTGFVKNHEGYYIDQNSKTLGKVIWKNDGYTGRIVVEIKAKSTQSSTGSYPRIVYTDGSVTVTHYVGAVGFNVKRVVSESGKVVDHVAWHYSSNSSATTVEYLFISKDINALYEPYTESTQYVIAKDTNGIVELRSVPSARDEINGNRLVKRVKEYVLQASDIAKIEYRTNVDVAVITLPNDSVNVSLTSTPLKFVFEKFELGATTSAGADNVIYIGKWCAYDSAARQVQIPFAKGTTLSTMQTAIVNSKVTYQLATPIETIIETSGVLLSYPNGTVYRENVVADAGVYNSGISILNTTLPIASIEKISKIDFATGTETSLDVSQAVIASDKKSFTHPSLAKNDIVFFTYFYSTESTNGELSVTYYDSRHVLKDTVNGKMYKIVQTVTNGVLTQSLVEV